MRILYHGKVSCFVSCTSTFCARSNLTPECLPRRHSVFPMGFLLGAPLAGLPESGLPPLRGAVATILLRLPVLKHLLAALGSFPAGAPCLPLNPCAMDPNPKPNARW